MQQRLDEDAKYWLYWVLASVAVAGATAVANETAKVVAEKLRKRWGLATPPAPAATPPV